MSTSTTRSGRPQLRNDIKEYIAEEVRKASRSFEPHGWRKLAHVLREIGPITGSVTVVLALLGLVVTLGMFASSRLREEAEFRGQTREQLKNLDAKFTELKGELTKQRLESHAVLPLVDFKAALPELTSAIAAANEQGVKVAPKLLDNLQERLVAVDSSAPDYWATAAQFISYRTALAHGDLVGRTYSIPRCVDLEPHSATLGQSLHPGNNTIEIAKITPAYLENCRIQLDAPEEAEKIGQIAQTYGIGHPFELRHCLVIYKGGAVEIPLGHAALKFAGCLWQISIPATPPEEGREILKRLVAGNVNDIQLALPIG